MRAKNMQALTNDIKSEHPGVVIYGIGDDEHKTRISDHNEDDTKGSKAAQSDGDNVPEHRAIDVMVGPKFSKAEASRLVKNLLATPSAKARLVMIIFDGHIYERSNGFQRGKQVGDQHTDHVHIAGLASDDNNASSWPAVKGGPAPTPKPTSDVLSVGDSGESVRVLQRFLLRVFPSYRQNVLYRPNVPLVVDGVFGGQTTAWVKEFQKRVHLTQDGRVGPATVAKLKEYGY